MTVVPSPKSQNHEMMLPSGSKDWSTKEISSLTVGFSDDTMLKSAVGAVFTTETCLVTMSVDPSLSVTVRVTSNVPSSGNRWVGFCSLLVSPSPKFQSQDTIPSYEVEVSVKPTVRASPVGAAVKSADGAVSATVM